MEDAQAWEAEQPGFAWFEDEAAVDGPFDVDEAVGLRDSARGSVRGAVRGPLPGALPGHRVEEETQARLAKLFASVDRFLNAVEVNDVVHGRCDAISVS